MSLARRDFLIGSAVALECLPGFAQALPARVDEDLTAAELRTLAGIAEAFMQRHDIPGMGIAIAHGDRIAYQAAFGLADRIEGTPLTTAHRFRIASISKSITATAVFRLVEDGKLGLGEPVLGSGAVLGTDYGPLPAGSRLGEITVDHLLTHSAGGWSNQRDDPMAGQLELDQPALIAWTLRHRPLEHAPGRHYAYSNFGYCLLGRVIERRAQQPYEAFVRQAVLAPAGVTDMAIAGSTLAERQADEVRYHAPGRENPYAGNTKRRDSNGGWLGRPAAIAQFAAAVGPRSGRRILKPATIAMMLRPSAVEPGYARGWAVNASGNAWHMGSLPGTSTIMVRTASRLAWAILTNGSQREAARRQSLRHDLDRLGWQMTTPIARWRV